MVSVESNARRWWRGSTTTIKVCAALVAVIAVAASAHAAASGCAGDCNADQKVTVDELIQAVRIALGEDPIASCPAADRQGAYNRSPSA